MVDPISRQHHDRWSPATAQWPQRERAVLARLRPDRMPRHIAIIMDGNGRWARQRGFRDRNRGHEAAIEAVRSVTRTCAELGLTALTLYAFSTENWQRPSHEINFLMRLLNRFLVDQRQELMTHNIRMQALGDLERLPPPTRHTLDQTMEMTEANDGLCLNLALSYGGRDEILRAVRRAARQAAQGRLDPQQLDESTFSRLLDTGGLPDPDLLIRTSGEMRISNFLLWQIAYAELYVTDVLWPDFARMDLLTAIEAYQNRERRFGRVSDNPARRHVEG